MAELLHDGCETPAPEWQKCLVHGAAKLAGAWTRAGRRSVYVTGRKVDCEIVVYVTTYLMREIQRLAGQRYGERKLRESFGFGAMQTVLETLRAAPADGYRYEARPDANEQLREALVTLARQKPRYMFPAWAARRHLGHGCALVSWGATRGHE